MLFSQPAEGLYFAVLGWQKAKASSVHGLLHKASEPGLYIVLARSLHFIRLRNLLVFLDKPALLYLIHTVAIYAMRKIKCIIQCFQVLPASGMWSSITIIYI